MIVPILGFFILASLAAGWVHRVAPNRSGWILSLIPLLSFGYGVAITPRVMAGRVVERSWEWVPALGIEFSYYVDGLSLLFVLLITGIGSLVLVYGGAYLKGHWQLGRFYTVMLLFMTAMLGLVVSDNLLVLFVFWELTSVASYLLIGFKHANEEARKSALRALVITGSGGLALLAGIILLGQAVGTYQYSELLGKADLIRQSPLYLPVLVLVLMGAFTKSAQFPFHFWLPGAMAAPTPISAYLHSATMVKAGFFLVARLTPVLGDTETWQIVVMLTGVITMLLGAIMAVVQTDLKKLLAYSTISALGLLFLLMGINTALSVNAAILFLIVHSLYKAVLFMVAGIIDQFTGTRDVNSLNGLFKTMPLVAVAAVLAAFSMSGLPPLLGFVGKELIYEAKIQAAGIYQWILVLTLLASALNVAIAFIVGVRPFWGEPSLCLFPDQKVTVGFWLGPVLLSVPSLLLGVFPGWIDRLSNAAASAVRAEPTSVKLALWHGFNLVLLMSVLTVLLGIALFGIREKLRKMRGKNKPFSKWRPKRLYERGFEALLDVAKTHTDWLQNGSLRFYLMVIMSTVVLAAGVTFFKVSNWNQLAVNFGTATLSEWAIAASILISAGMILLSDSRSFSVIAMGVIGYGVALIFVFYSAPDLAITQILVETLSVVLIVSVVYCFPKYRSLLRPARKWLNAILAVAFGGIMALVTLKAATIQLQQPVSDFYAQNSLTQGFGRNVVNVILVDFRAMDTLGEITVLGIAALGVFALLRWKDRTKGES